MTDREFAEMLQSTPREKTPEEVDRIEHEHDVERGEWINPHATYHHFGEAAH